MSPGNLLEIMPADLLDTLSGKYGEYRPSCVADVYFCLKMKNTFNSAR